MPRIRSIKPEAFDDEDLCELSPLHRWCYAGLWCQADKSGRMEDRPKRLKARVLPFDDVDMDRMLADLARAGFIIRYISGGKALLCIKPSSWEKHQRPRTDEPDSELPPPEQGSAVYASLGEHEQLGAALRKDVTDPTVTDASLQRDRDVTLETLGREGKGKEMGLEKSVSSEPPAAPSEQTPSAGTRMRVVDTSSVALVFPTIGPKGHEWALREAALAKWQSQFPTIDCRAEALKAQAWVEANPGRRKTVDGMATFLVKWFTRTTDSHRGPIAVSPLKTAGNVAAAERFVARGQA